MIHIIKTYINKPLDNIIIKKSPIKASLYIFSIFLHDLFRFLYAAIPMKIVLIMALHGVPGLLRNSYINILDIDVLIVYLLIFTFFSMFMSSVLVFLTAQIKKKIISDNEFSSIKNKKIITNSIFDLDIIAYFFLFLLAFIILNFIDIKFAIIVLSITFFLIFMISIFLKSLTVNLKNKFILKIQRKAKSLKNQLILAAGDIFTLIMFCILVIFYFFFNLNDGFHLIIATMMMRRIGNYIKISFARHIKIISR